MLTLLLAAAPVEAPPLAAEPRTAVDAERAFAADAQTLGQWTAFRKWAAPDATMFLPQPANAQAAMKDWRDPPHAIAWQPAASFVACDGTMAANTGPWRQPDGSVGFFSTVWVRQADGGWRWTVDGGDELRQPRTAPARPLVRRAACANRRAIPAVPDEIWLDATAGQGASADGTLRWLWVVGRRGARQFTVSLWNGHGFDVVIDDHIATPPPRPATP